MAVLFWASSSAEAAPQPRACWLRKEKIHEQHGREEGKIGEQGTVYKQVLDRI